MSESKHTATPWILKKKKTACGYCYVIMSSELIDRDHGGICLYDDNTSLNPHAPGEQEANAAFIVEACNSYDALKHDIERHIGITSSQAEEIESLKARNAELVKALNEAIETIKIWHGFDEPKDMREGSWQIYLKHSPEMKRITAALANENEST